MEYDREKVDELMLAMLFLTSSRDQYSIRAWKGLDWETLDRLYKKGYISDPQLKSPTLTLSPDGATLSEMLFQKHFGTKE